MNNQTHDPELITRWSERLKQKEGSKDAYQWLKDLHSAHINWREKNCINLLASEAPMSGEARALLSSPLASRTAAGSIGGRLFAGAQTIDDIEALCQATLLQLFDCRYAEHRVLGGTQACQIVYASQLNRGDSLVSVAEEDGGDSSNSHPSILSTIGVNVIKMPFEDDGLQIDFNALERLLAKQKVKMLSLGFSVSLVKPDHSRLSQLCQKYGVFYHVDCAHELGLIAGGVYPNPLSLGADVITASSGKTFSGPQGGLLLWNDPSYTQDFMDYTFPYSIGGYQNNRILALSLSALELLAFGQSYMQNVLLNTQSLSTQLQRVSFTLFGKSHTHQILLDSPMPCHQAIRHLEACNIITSPARCPAQAPAEKRLAIRLGLMEITRLGMKSSQMTALAELIARALLSQESSASIARDVSSLRADFQTVWYCHQYPESQ